MSGLNGHHRHKASAATAPSASVIMLDADDMALHQFPAGTVVGTSILRWEIVQLDPRTSRWNDGKPHRLSSVVTYGRLVAALSITGRWRAVDPDGPLSVTEELFRSGQWHVVEQAR